MNRVPQKNKRILIGFLSKTINGPIPIITNVYITELKNKYDFVPFYMERKNGKERLSTFNFLNLYYFIRQYFRWCWTIIKYRPAIVHFPVTSFWNMEKSLLFLTTAKFLGTKHTIGHLHGGAFIDFWQSISSFRRYFALKQFKKLDIFIVLSESWKDNIVKYIGIEEIKVKVLHNLIDADFEHHFRYFHREYDTKTQITILGFNIMDSRKGLYDLLEAVSRIPDKESFRLVIIGDEREPRVFETANKIIREKDLTNVSLNKGIWNLEKISWFEKADILVLPSYIENFPLVVLEASSAGIPVIASKLGALPDIFTQDHDILFIEPGNISQLGNYIKSLINKQNERKRLGENIKLTFEQHLTGKIIIEQLDIIYQSVLHQNYGKNN